MPPVSQAIPNLLGGVSQQSATQRDTTEGEEQINGVALIGSGLGKRPASQHSAVLSATPSAAYDSVHVHQVFRNSTDRYRVVLSNGDLKVFDAATGAEQTVNFPNGKAYLVTVDPARDLRCVTIGEYTYVTNKTIPVAKGTAKSPAAKNEALVFIRQADFATKYSLTLDSSTIVYVTPDGANARARVDIGTEQIATKIMTLLQTNSAFSAFAITQYGSTLYIKRTDGGEFSISASDGLADEGIKAIKGSVQRFDYLPDRAKNGFVVEITGDPDNEFDNYYVVYNDNGAPNLAGVWNETVKPGILTSLDAATMPHQLVRGAALLDGIEAGAIAAPPIIGLGSDTTYVDGWEKSGESAFNPVTDQTQQIVLDDHLEAYSSALQDLNGNLATVRVWFDMSTVKLPAGKHVEVRLMLSNAPSTSGVTLANCTTVASRQYQAGQTLYDQFLEADTTKPSNTRAVIVLAYPENVTPSNGQQKANVLLHTIPSTAKPSIEIERTTGRQVRFDPDALFPTSCVTTLTVGSTPYAHTSNSDETCAQVATALALLVASPYGATITDPGIMLITQTGGGAPAAVVASSFSNTTKLYSPTLLLTPSELIGQIVENTSDGSTGTITANTVTTITVGALTGGGSNKFNKGDLCSVIGAGTSYVFGHALWKPRKFGNIQTIPFPSIVGKKIGELFFVKNRLGMAAQGNIVMSQSGDSLNLFRQSATKLLPDDVIDVKSTKLADFHSALHWDEDLLLWTSDGQVVLTGQPNLTPETVGLDVKSQFINTTRLRPVVAGSKIFFARGKGTSTQIHEYKIVDQAGTADATDLTKHIPTYIAGTPIAMAVDSSLGFMAVLTDADQSKLYVCNYHYAAQQQLVQNAWSRWEFAPGTRIVSIDIIDGKLAMIVSRPQGVYLEIIDLDPTAV